jgi:hypothetical protein
MGNEINYKLNLIVILRQSRKISTNEKDKQMRFLHQVQNNKLKNQLQKE